MKKILVLTALVSALAFNYSQAGGGDGKDKAKRAKKNVLPLNRKNAPKKKVKNRAALPKLKQNRLTNISFRENTNPVQAGFFCFREI